MRKLFSLLMLAMVFALASCMKEEVDLGGGSEETVRISVNLPQQEALSRAAFSDPDLSENDMRVFLYVMYDGKIVSTVANGVSHNFGGGAFTRDIRLVTGKEYQIVAWADFGDKYYTVNTDDDIPTVVMASTTISGSNNLYDAYFYSEPTTFAAANATIDVKLKRPFALVRIQTLDYEEDAVVKAGLLPTNYTTTVSVPTTMNLLAGTVGPLQTVTIYSETANIADVEASGELSFDYFFASNDQANLGNFTVDYTRVEGEQVTPIVSYEFTNIPVRRNYKTNISGNILTKKGTINVTVDQNWDGTINENLEITPENLQTVLDELNTTEVMDANIVVTGKLPAGASYTLPAVVEGSSISIVLAGAEGNVTFESTDFKGSLNVSNTGDAIDLTVNVPAGDAVIGSGNWSSLTVTTKENTCIIEEGAVVEKLVVNGGNVKIYGTVNEITRGENAGDVTYYIASKAQLVKFAASVNDGVSYKEETVILDNDIDLENMGWTPIGKQFANRFQGTFDGNGKTIRNLTIDGRDKSEAAGLFGILNGVVKNLNIENANIKHIVDGNAGGIAVVTGSIYTSGTVENVTVKNAIVEGNRWTGGIVGYMYGSVTGCTLENITLTAIPDDLSGHYDNGDKVGGIVGYSAADNHGVISGNMAKNVTIKGYRDLGGIAGAANAVSLTGNTAENITIKVDQRTGYYGMETANAGVVLGRNLDGKTLDGTNISSGDNAISYVYFVENGTNLGQLKIASNSTYYIEAGEYASFGLYTQGKENIALIADGEVIVNGKLTFGTHSNYTRSIPESNLIEGFTVKGELFLSACGKFVVRNNKAAQITMKTFGLTEDPSYTSDIEFVDNITDGSLGTAPQKYGIYIVPNVTDYKLKITGNTIKNTGSHALVIQGSGDGSAKTTPGAYAIAENHFESWGLANGDNRGAVKVWADTAIAPESMEGGSVSDLSEAARTFVNSVLSGNNVFPDPLRENCVIFEFYGLPFNSLE